MTTKENFPDNQEISYFIDPQVYPYLAQYTAPLKWPERKIIGRQEEMASMQAAFERPELCNVMLLGDPGSGKALDNSTLIPVFDERLYVPIKFLQVGDLVFGRNGIPCRVIGVFPQGEKDAYKVIFANGGSLVCCEDHLYNVREGQEGAFKTQSLKQMLNILKEKPGSTLNVPMAEGLASYRADLPLDPYIVGLLVGGHEINDMMLNFLDGHKDLSLYLTVSPGVRTFPDIYLRGSFSQRKQLLDGYLTAQEIKQVDNTYICPNISRRLVRDLERLTASLGLRFTYHETETGLSGEIIADDHEAGVDIIEIKPLGKKVGMTCIKVDSEDELFIAGDYANVTHNTALVQGLMTKDTVRSYLEVNLSKMISDVNDPNEMAHILKSLFDEVSRYGHHEDHEVILFIDEFHQIVQLSPAAVEALKPLLADSGARGIKVVAATTYAEFRKYISDNQPLVERLQRISLKEPDKKTTVAILRGMAERYGISKYFQTDRIFELIYEYTNRYIPANSQPRKSILVLDAMVGWHRSSGREFNTDLLADVIYESEGVNVTFRVDAKTIKKKLDEKVLAQELATSVIENRLQLCVADLNDKSKPMSSFLFTGSTGVGKMVLDYEPVPVWSEDGPRFKAHGDLVPGDLVFNRLGCPVEVKAVIPHKGVDCYRVTLADGRHLDVGGDHLWGVYSSRQRALRSPQDSFNPMVISTVRLYEEGVIRQYNTGNQYKYYIPMGGAVRWTPENLPLDPYLAGALYMLHETGSDKLVFQNKDTYRGFLDGYAQSDQAQFLNPLEKEPGLTLDKEMVEIIQDLENIGYKPYFTGSVRQRMTFLQGIMDAAGLVGSNPGYILSLECDSRDKLDAITGLIYSLGYSVVEADSKDTKAQESRLRFRLRFRVEGKNKKHFFRGSSKKAGRARIADKNLGHKAPWLFDMVAIASIEPIGKHDASCIYVDDPEHLYQAGTYIVTHNTEMTKQLADLLFDDRRALTIFDMSEYARSESLERFRDTLTTRIWERPHSIILLDEIEKADGAITRLLLQVLDDGRLTDRNGREVSFTNAYIILTTNAASEIYQTLSQYSSARDNSAKSLLKYERTIRRSIMETAEDGKFPPELLGRIDKIVPFQPLNRETMERIVAMKLRAVRDDLLKKHDVRVSFDRDIIDFLVRDGLTTDSNAGGARAVMAKLEEEITTNIARFINLYPAEKEIIVKVEGQMAYRYKNKRESEAYITVLGAARQSR